MPSEEEYNKKLNQAGKESKNDKFRTHISCGKKFITFNAKMASVQKSKWGMTEKRCVTPFTTVIHPSTNLNKQQNLKRATLISYKASPVPMESMGIGYLFNVTMMVNTMETGMQAKTRYQPAAGPQDTSRVMVLVDDA